MTVSVIEKITGTGSSRAILGGLGGGTEINADILLDLSGSIPSGYGFAYTGSGSVATYWNSAGKLVAGSTNTPRFEFISGDPKGVLLEPGVTNKQSNANYNPSATTNMTLTGAGATLTVVNDAATLAASGLDLVCTNGNVYLLDNSGGGGTSYVEVNDTVGNTNKHSASVYAKSDSSGGGNINLLGAAAAVNVTSTTNYERYKLENVTPSGTGRKLRISAVAGRKVWFILNQLEEAVECSSVVLVSGAQASRTIDRLNTTTITDIFNQSEGAIVFLGDFHAANGRDCLPAIFSDGSTSNTIGLRVYTDNYIRPLVTAGGTQQSAVSISKILPGRKFGAALIWGGGSYSTHSGAGRRVLESAVTLPSTTLTRLDIGSRYNGSQPMAGHIRYIAIFKKKPSSEDIAQYMMTSGGKGVIDGGQSLADNLRRSQVELDNTGEVSFISTLDTSLTGTVGKNWLIHGATGGAGALLRNTTGGAWWYDDATGTFGDAWDTWEEAARLFIAVNGVGSVLGILWDQGQQDAAAMLAGTCTPTEYKAAVKIIIAKMRSIVGNVPVIIMPTVGRTDVSSGAYQILREAQWDLVTEITGAYRGPETFDLDKGSGDPVHLSSAGYTISGARSARKMLKVLGYTITGSVDGPAATTAVRTTTTIDVTIAHDGGTDFTPTTAIKGFHYFDVNGTEITITAAVRISATVIRLTLASGVAGTLYYGYDTLFAEAGLYASLVKDNSAQAMPLQSKKWTVA